ncbi:MAG: right-handed parallel beta-helix repeat-containing protein [Promethearchaeota archaeon]
MKKYLKIPLLVVGIVFFFSSIFLSNSYIFLWRDSNEFNSQRLNSSAVSEKINIYANNGWIDLKLAGKCSGSGTHLDPYVLRDLVINGDHTGSCIVVDSTTRFFKIVNCTVYHAGTEHYDAGIALIDADNGQLINNTVHTNSRHGILVSWSSYVSVTGNNIYNNYEDGIFVDFGFNVNVTGNTMDSNWDGIQISYGSNNRITGNTITNNHIGIHVYHSEDYFISNNIFSGNNQDTSGIPIETNPIPTAVIVVIIAVIVPIILIAIIVVYKKRTSRRAIIEDKIVPKIKEIDFFPLKEVKSVKPRPPPETKVSDIISKTCPQCGQKLYSNAKFCIKCGQKIEEDQIIPSISEIIEDKAPQIVIAEVSSPKFEQEPKTPTISESKELNIPQMKSDDLEIPPILEEKDGTKLAEIPDLKTEVIQPPPLIREEKEPDREIEQILPLVEQEQNVSPVLDIKKKHPKMVRNYCQFCGDELKKGAIFCPQCGTKVKKK